MLSSLNLDPRKVSLIIPAYNQPGYLRQALQSALAQTHRPLEIIVSDDDSPHPLEPVVREFKEQPGGELNIRFFRQPANLGVMDNFLFALRQATGRYLMPFAHDNRFIDRRFLSEAVDLMESQPDCHLCFANAVFEHSSREMLSAPERLSAGDGWVVIPGDEFIRKYRRGGLDWSQAVVVDHAMASSLNAYENPFMVNRTLARSLGVAEDNAYAYLFVLSAVGSVGFSRKLVCEIGTPAESYSRSDPTWNRTKKKLKFIIFFNLYRADLKGPHAAAVKQMAFKQAFDYVDYILDPKIAAYYRYHPLFLLLAMVCVARRPWIGLRAFIKKTLGRNPLTGRAFKKVQR